jgi:hypothetical protein
VKVEEVKIDEPVIQAEEVKQPEESKAEEVEISEPEPFVVPRTFVKFINKFKMQVDFVRDLEVKRYGKFKTISIEDIDIMHYYICNAHRNGGTKTSTPIVFTRPNNTDEDEIYNKDMPTGTVHVTRHKDDDCDETPALSSHNKYVFYFSTLNAREASSMSAMLLTIHSCGATLYDTLGRCSTFMNDCTYYMATFKDGKYLNEFSE